MLNYLNLLKYNKNIMDLCDHLTLGSLDFFPLNFSIFQQTSGFVEKGCS